RDLPHVQGVDGVEDGLPAEDTTHPLVALLDPDPAGMISHTGANRRPADPIPRCCRSGVRTGKVLGLSCAFRGCAPLSGASDVGRADRSPTWRRDAAEPSPMSGQVAPSGLELATYWWRFWLVLNRIRHRMAISPGSVSNWWRFSLAANRIRHRFA